MPKVLVIGAGPAGILAALRAAHLGAQTAIGGMCAHVFDDFAHALKQPRIV